MITAPLWPVSPRIGTDATVEELEGWSTTNGLYGSLSQSGLRFLQYEKMVRKGDGMDLQTFVAETLKQISAGIKDAQQANTGAWICPPMNRGDAGKRTYIHASGTTHDVAVQEISFDIALEVTDGSSTSGEAKISVLTAILGGTAGGSKEKSTQQMNASRINFTIPVRWPIHETPPAGHGSFEPMPRSTPGKNFYEEFSE